MRRMWTIGYRLRDAASGQWTDHAVNFQATDEDAARGLARAYLTAGLKRGNAMNGIAAGKVAEFTITGARPVA